MKTFKTLSISDPIFIIQKSGRLFQEKDRYGNKYEADWFKTESVKNIMEENGFIRINEFDSRNQLLKIPVSNIDDTVFIGERCIYFLNESEVTEWKRNFLVSKIRESEQSIIDAENKSKKFIEDIRKEYYEILNFIEA